MKSKVKTVVVLMVVFFTIISIFFFSKKPFESKVFYCEGNIKTRNQNFISEGTLRYEFNKETGIAIYNGIVSDNKHTKNFSYKIYFSYTKDNNSYVLKSTNIINLGDEEEKNDILDMHKRKLPAFYKSENELYTIGIYKVSDNGFLLYNVFVPYLYCSYR